MFGLKDLSGLPTLKDLAGLGPSLFQEQVLPPEDRRPEEEGESAPRDEETFSEEKEEGEKEGEPGGENSKDLG
jgi:hypothetical protein